MTKYIDADALKIEIKHHIELMEKEPTRYAKARIDEANETLSVIDALAREYKSIDLDKLQSENICHCCVHHNKTDDICEYPYGKIFRINKNGVYECNWFEKEK